MATLGLIGSGHIGGTLARLAVGDGLDVVVSNSRGPQTLSDLVAELGPRATAANPARRRDGRRLGGRDDPVQGVRAGPREPLAGKTVIDTNNYYPQRDGNFPELDAGTTTSSELLQRHLAGRARRQGLQQHLLQAPRRPAPALGRRGPYGAADRGRRRPVQGRAGELLDILGYDRSTPVRSRRAGGSSRALRPTACPSPSGPCRRSWRSPRAPRPSPRSRRRWPPPPGERSLPHMSIGLTPACLNAFRARTKGGRFPDDDIGRGRESRQSGSGHS